ncbi:MAG: asparagine synthase (glutamine-hydrolyzing) [Rhodothermales bacterium]
MCGIAGYMHLDPRTPPDPEILVGMAAIQAHRGPDGFGWHVMPERGVGFSHARLAIIDLEERGRQPMVSADGRLMLTHNGEFYDFPRIRAGLTARGARFRSKSDSELILHLYPRLGLEGTLEQLRGEFAFALYDAADESLVLVRDRFGIKPLYWTETADALVFGSEVKVLFAHPDVRRAFSDAGVFHQLMQTMVPGTTPYKNIHQVKPGHALRVRRGPNGFRIEDLGYWDMPFPEGGARGPRRADDFYIDEVRERLIEAVQLRLVADVPVGCYLSGGIDSCSMLGLASASRQEPVKAFTIGFDDAAYDETAIAASMAASVGADQDVLALDAAHLYDHFVETHWHTERTIYNTLGVAKLLMSRHVHEAGYKVVVTGEGSDELFGGYPSFRRDLFLHGLDDLPPAERAAMEALLQESNQLFSGAMLAAETVEDPSLEALCGFTPSCLQPWLMASRRVPALLAPGIRNALGGYRPGEAIAAALDGDAIRGRHPLDIAQYVWIKTMLEGQILTWGGDRVDMANSMEARPAFLDHHLAAFAAQLPPDVRIRGRVEKYVLREAMKGLLPEVLYRREKFAFMAPPAHTDAAKRNAVHTLADDYLSDASRRGSGASFARRRARPLAVYDGGRHARRPRSARRPRQPARLGVQILQRTLIDRDIPALARSEAERLGWGAGVMT